PCHGERRKTRGARPSALDLAAERREADGLRQMQIEAGIVRGGTVLVAAVAGQSDEPDALELRHPPCPAGDLVAVHAWQIDVDDGGIRPFGDELRESVGPGRRGVDSMPRRLEQHPQTLTRIVVVLYDQYPHRKPCIERLTERERDRLQEARSEEHTSELQSREKLVR